MAKLIRDTGLLFRSHLADTLRNPIWVILGLFQPICWLLLFAPLLDGMPGASNLLGGNAFNVFTPGLLVMSAIFSCAYVGFGLVYSLRGGVIERLRVTPVSRLALPLSYVLRDVLVLLVQSALLVGLALLMGLRPDPLGLLLLVGLLVLIGVTLASVSYALALLVKDENAMASTLNFFSMPLILLSGITLPLTFAPALIKTLANLNPFSHAVDTARALVDGNLATSDVPLGFVIFVALAVLAMGWAVRSFRQATA